MDFMALNGITMCTALHGLRGTPIGENLARRE